MRKNGSMLLFLTCYAKTDDKVWGEYLLHIEFSCDSFGCSITIFLSLEITYGFHLYHYNFTNLPLFKCVNLYDQKNAKVVEHVDDTKWLNIGMKMKNYVKYSNKRWKKKFVFDLGGCDLCQVRRKEFRRPKSARELPAEDGRTRTLKYINNNFSKLDLQSKYNLVLHSMLLIYFLFMQIMT